MRLCDVCDFQGGSQPPKNEWSFEQKDGYIRMLQIRDFTQTRNVEKEYIKLTSSTKTCVTEDILIARYGASIGKILTGLSGAYNVAIMKTIPNEGILNKSYLKYYLLSNYFQNGINSVGARAAQAGFNKEDLSKLYIPVVSLVQQKLIVDKLNKLTTFIGKRKTQLEKLDELVKSRFIEMFGDPVNNSKKLPKLTLPELGEVGRGVSKHRPRNDPQLLGGKYPLIQTSEIAKSDLYITEYESTYSELGFKQSKLWQKGTLCITIAANIAKTAILTFDACFPDSVVGFKANGRTNNIFIHYWFSFFQTILEAQAPESAQKNINLKALSELYVIVPPIELQSQFAAFVKQVDKSKFEIKQSLEKLELLKKALMQKYFG